MFINNNAVINNNFGPLEVFVLFFKISVATGKCVLETYGQFGHVRSKWFATKNFSEIRTGYFKTVIRGFATTTICLITALITSENLQCVFKQNWKTSAKVFQSDDFFCSLLGKLTDAFNLSD